MNVVLKQTRMLFFSDWKCLNNDDDDDDDDD